MAEKGGKNVEKQELSRRSFLKLAGGTALGVALGGAVPQLINLGEGVIAIPASNGYLIVDTTKCAGCTTCMAACSLAHEGSVNLSLSRIQIKRNPFGDFGEDIFPEQCRQCTFPACVEACPTGAMHTDSQNGNVRMVDERKCIGCMQCIEACTQQPSRVQWNHEKNHAQKCDLCANTPYWDEDKPACATLCPMGAIKYTTEIPSQLGAEGYRVDLKPAAWGNWWPYKNYTTWPKAQSDDPATWPSTTNPEGGKK